MLVRQWIAGCAACHFPLYELYLLVGCDGSGLKAGLSFFLFSRWSSGQSILEYVRRLATTFLTATSIFRQFGLLRQPCCLGADRNSALFDLPFSLSLSLSASLLNSTHGFVPLSLLIEAWGGMVMSWIYGSIWNCSPADPWNLPRDHSRTDQGNALVLPSYTWAHRGSTKGRLPAYLLSHPGI